MTPTKPDLLLAGRGPDQGDQVSVGLRQHFQGVLGRNWMGSLDTAAGLMVLIVPSSKIVPLLLLEAIGKPGAADDAPL